MNELPTDPAMLDRLEVICVDEYTSDERRLIASDYLFPKYMNELSILKNIVLTDDGVKKIVDLSANHLHKKGVRDLERSINLIIEKIYFFICNRDVDYDYPWYKKIKDSIDSENRVMITGVLVEKILEDSKKTEYVYVSMYM
jgi:ATP-dependent Lon protease